MSLDFARAGRWNDAYTAIGMDCANELDRLGRAHDALYGPGTGDRFLRGAYISDLPRVISERIKPAIARRNQEIEAEHAKSEEAEQDRIKVIDAANEEHFRCMRAEMASLLPYSSENAEILATVILEKCSSYEQKKIDLGKAIFPELSRQEIEATVAEGTARSRTKLISDIVSIRAKAARSLKQEQPQPPRPAAKSF